MPCKSLHMTSPYELLFHKTPDLTHLKIFCSSCYPYLLPYARDKLESRTLQCVFLGYALGYKGVICYNLAHNKLWISRHVIHDETCFPFLTISSSVVSLIDLSTLFSHSMSPPTHFFREPAPTFSQRSPLPAESIGPNGDSGSFIHPVTTTSFTASFVEENNMQSSGGTVIE